MPRVKMTWHPSQVKDQQEKATCSNDVAILVKVQQPIKKQPYHIVFVISLKTYKNQSEEGKESSFTLGLSPSYNYK